MKRAIAIFVFIPLFSNCGVNPERAKDLRIVDDLSSTSKMVKDPNDDPGILEAIDSVEALSDSVDALDFAAIRKSRTKVFTGLHTTQSTDGSTLAAHPKTPLILRKIDQLDMRLAEKMGSDGLPLADLSRSQNVNPEAQQAFSAGVQLCQSVKETKTTKEVETLEQNLSAEFGKAANLDANVLRYSTRKNVDGTFVDNPFEYALCRYQVATRFAEVADLEPAFADLSSTYVGCAGLDLAVVAKQESNGAFGPYLLTSKSAFAETAPDSRRVECSTIPAASDAPKGIISLVKSNVQWLKPNDILSMKGEFKNTDESGEMMKVGSVSVLRRDAGLKTNACGAKDAVVVCSQLGNEVSLSFDLGTHYIERSKIYKTNGNVERCEAMAKKAVELTSKELAYDGKLLYQTNRDRRLQPSEIKSKIEAMKAEATTMLSTTCKPKTNN